jgi:hypothetical protein
LGKDFLRLVRLRPPGRRRVRLGDLGHRVGVVSSVQHGVGADMQSVRQPVADGAQQVAAQRASDTRDLRPRGWAKNGPIELAGLSPGVGP